MEQIYNYIRLGFIGISIKLDSDNILYMPYYNYFDFDLYDWDIDKKLYAKYGKEKLWLYLDNGYIEKFVWDEVSGHYVQ